MRTLRLSLVGTSIVVLLVGLGGGVVAQMDEEGPASMVGGGSLDGGSPAGIDAPGTTTYTEIEGVPYLTVVGDTFEADIYVPENERPSAVVVMVHGAAPRGKDDPCSGVVELGR